MVFLLLLLGFVLLVQFGIHTEKQNKQVERMREIEENIKIEVAEQMRSGKSKIEILMEMRATCEGILNASARQHINYNRMPDGVAKVIEKQVIDRFADFVNDVKLRLMIIQSMIDSELSGKK